MTGTNRNLFWVRSGRDPQRDGSVPKLVEYETVQSGRGDRRLPPQPTKASPSKRRSLRPGKDERVSPGRDVGVEMGAEFLNDAPGKRDRTPRPPRLGRAEGKFAVNVREGLSDRDTAPEHVNPLAPRPSQFAEAQATVNRQENQDAKAGFDGVGKGSDFLGAEESLLLDALGRKGHVLTRVERDTPVRDWGLHHLVKRVVSLAHGGRG
jgi:hypothetical protein